MRKYKGPAGFWFMSPFRLVLWEKRDARAGNEWDSGGLWANARGRPNVITCYLCYSECMDVSMMHGREH